MSFLEKRDSLDEEEKARAERFKNEFEEDKETNKRMMKDARMHGTAQNTEER